MPDTNITKSALAASMKRLLKEKSFSKISVVDICEGCGMNRKSFYYHFKDKYDLVNWIFYSDFIKKFNGKEHNNGWDLLISICDLFYQNQDFYRAVLKIEGQNSFRDYFFESMRPIVAYLLNSVIGTNNEEEEETEEEENLQNLITDILCDTCLSGITKWLTRGCKSTPEEFIRYLKQIIFKIAKQILINETL